MDLDCEQLIATTKKLLQLIDSAQENRIVIAAHDLAEDADSANELARYVDCVVGWLDTTYPAEYVVKRSKNKWVLTLTGAGMLLARLDALTEKRCGVSLLAGREPL
jgi:hypothetical protein